MGQKVYVIDTNVVLQNIQNIYNLADNKQNIIVLPETVLIELEDKKKLISEVGYYAREFARFLAKTELLEVENFGDFKVVKLLEEHAEIHIISKEHYNADVDMTHISESNDKRIIEVAEIAKVHYSPSEVIFLSLDIYARTFAVAKQIKTQTLRDDRSDIPDFEFVKKIELDSSHFNRLEMLNIQEVDPDYKPENFGYEFHSEDGNSRYAIVINEKVHVVDDSDFKNLAVKPVNLKQKFFMKAILTNYLDLMVIDAKAGSGKTLISLVSAMRLIDLGHYDKIVYVRNSIESIDKGADIGYLSGNEEKFRVYNLALYDTVEFIAKKLLKNSENKDNLDSIKTKAEHLMGKYNIETLWPGEARGRTLSGAIVILDEWQNSSEKTTQLLLSRLDESCMAIVIGSNRQIDNMYLNRFNNGLTTLLKQTRVFHPELKMFAIELEAAVRGKFAQYAERIFEHKRS